MSIASTPPNKPDAANPAMALWLTIDDQWRRVADLERWPTMRAAFLCGLLLALSSGCFFGDPAAHRSVLLQLPAAAQSTDPEVQEALGIVDAVMIARGVSRDTNAPASSEQNAIAIYDVWSATGQKVVYAGPTVYLRDGRLDVDFFEFPARRSSPRVRTICSEIADRFSTRYGDQRVRIEH